MNTLIDRTFALLRKGYRFTSGRATERAWVIRLLGRRTAVVGGRAGVQLFYDESKLRRLGALPGPLRNTLFGEGAVHGLDDAAHRHRKQLFVSLLTPQAAAEIASRAATGWQDVFTDAYDGGQVNLFTAAIQVHAAAVCDWAGVPGDRVDIQLAHDLASMVDGFGSIGRRHLAARRARHRANVWAATLIEQVRAGGVDVPAGSAVRVVAAHRDEDGRLLAVRVAGVELLNVLRPAVAVAWFVAFTALALHEDPLLPERLRKADDAVLVSFAHELRRLYPFVPLLGARARVDFEWNGVRVPNGTRLLLDVYGTLHDPQLWQRPQCFDLDRFAGVEPDPFTLIPQGGGDATSGHRCPGERVTIELIKVAARTLTSVSYEVPRQDLRVSLSRMPTRPRSGFVVTGVRPARAPL